MIHGTDELQITTNPLAGHRLGEIVLSAERRLNALSPQMCETMSQTLTQWNAADSQIKAVVVEGAGERAFCAGGDIQHIYHGIVSDQIAKVLAFFRSEYRNNWHAHNFHRPYIAISDGITMGGGVGVSFVANMPVVTERTVFAMPETLIGYIPDVGMTSYLRRMGAVGNYIALTGAHLRRADLIFLGLAEHAVNSSAIAALKSDIASAIGKLGANCSIDDSFTAMNSVLEQHREEPTEASEIAANSEVINRCFDESHVGAIIENLRAEGTPWSAGTLADLARRSPTMLAVTLQHIIGFSDSSVAQALERDFAVAHTAVEHGDLQEGIRAQVIDKDRQPQWQPFDLMGYSSADIEHWFALPRGASGLDLIAEAS